MVASNGAKISVKTKKIILLFNERKKEGKILKVSLKSHAIVCYVIVWYEMYGMQWYF